MVRTTAWQTSPVQIHKRTFAVGDVHGCAGALAQLLKVVNQTQDEFELIFLGDLIDRGPNSLAVLDQVWSWHHEFGEKTILPGNHELMMLMALHTPKSFMPWWRDNGGETLLDELGVRQEPVHVQVQMVQQALSNKLLDIIDAPTGVIRDGYLFVHAGVPEHMTPAQVCEYDWHGMDGNPEQHHPLWVRQAFLENTQSYSDGIMVVHGHTPTRHKQPELHSNRINVDGGSCFGGNLCMVELMADKIRFHTVWGGTSYLGQ
jgi:serine/threonine protein phosphatase 1